MSLSGKPLSWVKFQLDRVKSFQSYNSFQTCKQISKSTLFYVYFVVILCILCTGTRSVLCVPVPGTGNTVVDFVYFGCDDVGMFVGDILDLSFDDFRSGFYLRPSGGVLLLAQPPLRLAANAFRG